MVVIAEGVNLELIYESFLLRSYWACFNKLVACGYARAQQHSVEVFDPAVAAISEGVKGR